MPRPVARRIGTAATCLILAASLAACSDDPDDTDGTDRDAGETTPLAEADWSDLTVPVRRLQAGTADAFSTGLSASGALPYVWFDQVSPPGKASEAVARTSKNGRDWQDHEVVSAPDSYVSDAATDGTTTVAVGTTWADGNYATWLATSKNRTSWDSSELAATDGFLGSTVTLVEAEPLVVGLDRERRARAVVPGSDDLATLPEPPRGATLSEVVGSAAIGQRVVAVLRGRAAGDVAAFAAVSTDGGQDWTIKRILPEVGTDARGVVAVGRSFVITGSAGEGDTRAAAWSSTNGTSWKRERVPALPRQLDGWDTYLSEPQVDAGTVVAGGWNEVCRRGVVLVRSGSGSWGVRGITEEWNAPGVFTAAIGGPQGLVTSRTHSGRLQRGLTRNDGRWVETSTSGLRKNASRWGEAAVVDDKPLVSADRMEVDLRPNDGWSWAIRSEQLAVSGTKVDFTDVQPPQAAGLRERAGSTDEDGNTVVVGWELHSGQGGNDTDAVGWFKAAGGNTWVRAKGLSTPRTDFVTGVKRLGTSWVAWGYDRADFTSSTHGYGVVWESADGKTWKVVSDRSFDPDPKKNTSVSDVCETDDGILALINTENSARGSLPGALRRTAKGWTSVDLASLGDDFTYATNCTSSEGTILLQGATPSGERLWRSSDLSDWTELELGRPGDTIGTVRETADGFAAPGELSAGEQSQPVVWLSADGEKWRPVEVPGENSVDVTDVLPWGDRLIALTTAASGLGATILDNPAELYEDISSG